MVTRIFEVNFIFIVKEFLEIAWLQFSPIKDSHTCLLLNALSTIKDNKNHMQEYFLKTDQEIDTKNLSLKKERHNP